MTDGAGLAFLGRWAHPAARREKVVDECPALETSTPVITWSTVSDSTGRRSWGR
jgi:hypothetical protein